jgi:aerobic carbon-monoxide dehydrogenase medium subunit
VYPAKFEYFAPTTVDEALELLGRYDDGEAKVLAGGMSLIPVMKLRIAAPRALVDINRIEGLDTLAEDGGKLRIGALVRHKTCERSGLLKGRYGALGDAAPLISDPIVRNLGTVAGSIVHADPQGDWGSVMLAVRGELVAQSADGERTIPIDDFFHGPFMTSLRPNEIVTEVRVPVADRAGGTYLKLERKVGDFATVGIAVHVAMSNGTVEQAGIGLTGVGPTNIRAAEAEEALTAHALDDEAIDEAARLAAAAAEPQSDGRGTEEYKRNVIRILTARGLRRAKEVVAS